MSASHRHPRSHVQKPLAGQITFDVLRSAGASRDTVVIKVTGAGKSIIHYRGATEFLISAKLPLGEVKRNPGNPETLGIFSRAGEEIMLVPGKTYVAFGTGFKESLATRRPEAERIMLRCALPKGDHDAQLEAARQSLMDGMECSRGQNNLSMAPAIVRVASPNGVAPAAQPTQDLLTSADQGPTEVLDPDLVKIGRHRMNDPRFQIRGRVTPVKPPSEQLAASSV